MAVDIPKLDYSGKIREITLGAGENSVSVGGEDSYPFYLFEGSLPNPPKIAFEVYDSEPEDFPGALKEAFGGLLSDPAGWAAKCAEEFKADLICLRLASTDPNGGDRTAEDVIPVVQKVMDAVKVPLIVWGSENDDKDAEVLPAVAEACHGKKLVIGPATESNYKRIGAACIAYGHTVVAGTPIDINLAKQLNILLGDLGVPDEQIIIDPNVGGSSLGYGLEYTYSVMERLRQAALTQQDAKLQFPMILNCAEDVWKKREVNASEEEEPALGGQKDRGVVFESLNSVVLLAAGADILVVRHPESAELVRGMAEQLAKT